MTLGPSLQLQMHKNSWFSYFSHRCCRARPDPGHTVRPPRSETQGLVVKVTAGVMVTEDRCVRSPGTPVTPQSRPALSTASTHCLLSTNSEPGIVPAGGGEDGHPSCLRAAVSVTKHVNFEARLPKFKAQLHLLLAGPYQVGTQPCPRPPGFSLGTLASRGCFKD